MPQSPRSSHQPSGEPDVCLSVPDLHVDEIRLAVEHLDADVALQARLANLLDLRAGAHVVISKVDLDIKGVAARAILKVRLENVFAILDRALTSLDRNPQLIEGVIDTVDDAIEGVSRVVTTRPPSRRLHRAHARLRALPLPRPRVGLSTKVATAAGLVGGAALAAHGNGGLEKTIKQLTS
jgi:hypothetical protein